MTARLKTGDHARGIARRPTWIAVLALWASVAATAPAQNADDLTQATPASSAASFTAGDALDLARQLGDGSWAVRDRAERALLSYPTTCVAQVESLLVGGDTISPEHRQRLLNVCRQRFILEPRAALGIRQGNADERGVVIEVALTNFDAARVLRSGDIILTMDGMPVRTYEELRAAIVSHDPGDWVAIQALRGSEVHRVEARLGAFADLRERASIEHNIMRLAWEWRLRRLGVASEEPPLVENGLAPARWTSARDAAAAASPPVSRRHGGGDDGVIDVSMGGEPTGAAPPRGGRAATRVVIHNADNFRDQASPRAVQLALAQRQLDNIRTQINTLTGAAEAFERTLTDGDLGVKERAELEQQVNAIRRAVDSLRMSEQAAAADVARWSR